MVDCYFAIDKVIDYKRKEKFQNSPKKMATRSNGPIFLIFFLNFGLEVDCSNFIAKVNSWSIFTSN